MNKLTNAGLMVILAAATIDVAFFAGLLVIAGLDPTTMPPPRWVGMYFGGNLLACAGVICGEGLTREGRAGFKEVAITVFAWPLFLPMSLMVLLLILCWAVLYVLGAIADVTGVELKIGDTRITRRWAQELASTNEPDALSEGIET